MEQLFQIHPTTLADTVMNVSKVKHCRRKHIDNFKKPFCQEGKTNFIIYTLKFLVVITLQKRVYLDHKAFP